MSRILTDADVTALESDHELSPELTRMMKNARAAITEGRFLAFKKQAIDEMERGEHKLVYIAPERCDSPRFQRFVREKNRTCGSQLRRSPANS